MKKHFLFFALLIASLSFGQTSPPRRISFKYDSAGNQTKRFVCEGCASRVANDSTMTSKTKLADKIIPVNKENHISYYPNPVLEELNIKWSNEEGPKVIVIEVYSMTGQLMKKNTDLQSVDTAIIGFQSYPEGFYNVILVFDSGEKKTLKIIKQ